MSVLEAVLLLATVIKQVVDDSQVNFTVCSSLAARVEIVPRVLKKYPDPSELDDDLLQRMYGCLKESHDIIMEYKNKGSVSRLLMASSMKAKFLLVEEKLGRCIDDLSFNVGVTSAAKINAIHDDIKREAAQGQGWWISSLIYIYI
jgi:hypothetical protein